MVRKLLQLDLALSDPPRWGGRRSGAGRKPGPKPPVRHARRRLFGRTVPAHVTLRVLPGVPSLRTVPIVQAIERTFALGCERQDFRLAQYSLQGNHAHLIVEAASPEALGRGMKAIGARLALAVNRIARRKGRVLAERYHVRLLPTPREVRNALRYVLLNARKHAARSGSPGGAVARLFDPASSARWFEGWKREGVVTGRAPASRPRAAPSPVARARTWLLSVGWRKHGLLDPADVPG